MTITAHRRAPPGYRPLDTISRRPATINSYSLALVILFACCLISPVAASELIVDDLLTEFTDTGDTRTVTQSSAGGYTTSINQIAFKDITNHPELRYIIITGTGNLGNEGTTSVTCTLSGDPTITNTATIYTKHLKNSLGTVTHTRTEIFFDEWEIGSLTGTQILEFNQSFWPTVRTGSAAGLATNDYAWVKTTSNQVFASMEYKITVASVKIWQNHIKIYQDDDYDLYEIDLQRVFDGDYNPSTIYVYQESNLELSDYDTEDFNINVPKSYDKIKINSGTQDYLYTLGTIEPPSSDSVTVYVRNSQTGALLANAHIDISANVNGSFYEVVVNETVPSGIYSIDLQPTGGGIPNPDYYRLWVTLDGYNSQMPYMDFEVTGVTSIYEYMEPTTGGPVDENMTFVEFYVRDIYANPLANANVNCGGYTLKTNSAGYTQFELPKNAAYSYIVSKTGYLTIEGIARVESDDRYTANVALMAGVVPTQTAVTPTITVEPTPTQTTPPIQEDNIIGLSVKGLAKGFGIDYDTALLLFGLMIVFGAGGIVMSSVKGGAMEFIAGSIVGTFVAFALGLIPIWIFIIIAVVFGAYVLRVFIQGGQ